MTLAVLAWVSFVFAAIPTYVFLRNFFDFRRLPAAGDAEKLLSISVLIPARNEENSIGPCLKSVTSNTITDLEVIVLDDQSEDQTASRVREIIESDPRVRLGSANPLPAGWCGKQHACAELSKSASNELLIFLDADVRLSSDALARIATEYARADVDLLSGFPRQRTETIAERMLIPLMHFVLLGFLSLRRMRDSTHPAFGAGCGQLFITSREAYERSGGHSGIRKSLHDGIKLPRLYRSKGMKTDLFDGTDIASCRMYRNATEVWFGLKKNATEGVANAKLIVPVTAMLLCGQVLPFLLLGFALCYDVTQTSVVVIVAACCLSILPRLVSAVRYQQSFIGALLHPAAIVVFLVVQWSAFFGSFSKRTVTWKGRPYTAA